MKSTLLVKRLNKTGRYISKLDTDKAFVSDENPNGYFKMVVEAINLCADEKKYVIRYEKADKGYWVTGEGYIITGSTEREIDADIKEHHTKRFPNLVNEEDL